MQKIDEEWVEAAVLGGAILGGGGGGSLEEGRRLGRLALELGSPTILSLDQFSDDSLIVTVSAVGAPSADKRPVPSDFAKAARLLIDHLDGGIDGFMTNELGGLAVVNGLVQSAILEVPIVDAACNGRAYPIGTMGAMGLSMSADFISQQAAIGGSREEGSRVEIYAEGALAIVSRLVIKASDEVGGLIAVARNPLPVAYIKENAAVGALSQAIELGEAYLEGQTGVERVERAVAALDGSIATWAKVDSLSLTVQGGLDVGHVRVGEYELTFWNEYMTLERDGERIATFPDLIMTMEAGTGQPLSSARVRQGQQIVVVTVPRDNLNLGAGMRDPKLFYDVEKVIGKEIVKYVFPEEQ